MRYIGKADAAGRWYWVPARERIKLIQRSARLRLYADPLRRAYERGWLPTARLTLPEFLGIGAPKTGTTWLHHNLAAHPDLYLPDHKELHYFTGHRHRSLHWYARHFADAGQRMPGEITPGYAMLPTRDVRRLHALVPDARLMLLVRDPIQRAWSHAVMKLARELGRPVGDVSDDEFLAHFRGAHSLERGNYLQMIAKWRSVFPPEQLWIGSYDDIKEQPRRLLVEVFTHLGVTVDVDWDTFPHNEVIDRGVHGTADVFGKSSRPQVPERFIGPLESLLIPQIEQFAREYPHIGKRWLP